tara:strand:+ start:466 stop:678 length:213 start_codon:yes stop_codon:yes gene_type:complete
MDYISLAIGAVVGLVIGLIIGNITTRVGKLQVRKEEKILQVKMIFYFIITIIIMLAIAVGIYFLTKSGFI